MDPLTHALTGLAMSRAGLNRLHPRATGLLILAAEAPDVDIVYLSRGAFSYFAHHRWLTHTFVAAPLLAAAVSLLFCVVHPSWKKFRAGFVLAFAAVLSHLLLDWTNAYGIRFLLPFSPHWFSLDLTNVVDPWIWLVLLIAAVGPPLGKLVSSEMGAKGGSGRGLAIFALLFLCLYNLGRALPHHRAVETLESRIYDGAPPLKAGAFPTLLNPAEWEGVVDTRSAMRKYDIDLTAPFDPDSGRVFEKPEPNAAMRAAAQTSVFRTFLGFSKYPLWSAVPAVGAENSTEVDVVDLRFGFHVSALVGPDNRVRDTHFGYR